ncbi:MAG: hypothetical protein QOC70_342 [Verrucomicrobiota bacterium]
MASRLPDDFQARKRAHLSVGAQSGLSYLSVNLEERPTSSRYADRRPGLHT